MRKIKLNQNKKAILPATVLKMIIAVLCIVGLLMLAVKLYTMFTYKTDIEQARENLNQLMAELKTLGNGESGEYLITGPSSWYVISYKKGENSPKQCNLENCLCFCNGFNIGDCDSNGICEKSSDEIKITELNDLLGYDTVSYFKIKAAINLVFEKQGSLIKFDISPSLLNDGGFFNKFLDSKSEFLDKGKITIAEQIKYYINSGSASGFRDGNAERAVIKNIQDYFAEYNYPINIFILPGKGYAQLNINVVNLLKISAGKDRSINNGEQTPDWPYLIIENPEKEGSLKSLVVATQIRK